MPSNEYKCALKKVTKKKTRGLTEYLSPESTASSHRLNLTLSLRKFVNQTFPRSDIKTTLDKFDFFFVAEYKSQYSGVKRKEKKAVKKEAKIDAKSDFPAC